jgi:hypothetical protein
MLLAVVLATLLALARAAAGASFWSSVALPAFARIQCVEDTYESRDGRALFVSGGGRDVRVPLLPPAGSVFGGSMRDVSDIARGFVETVLAEWPVANDPAAWPLDADFGVARMRDVLERRLHAAPFVQRALLPPQSVVATFGDLHGSFHSFLRHLRSLIDRGYLDEDLRVVPAHRSSFFMLFLGDYVDRGNNGLEVLLTLLHLRLRNPRNVLLARGNHEDAGMNEGDFSAEVRAKFPSATQAELDAIHATYNTLPVAVFLGVQTDDDGDHDDEAGEGPAAPSYLLCVHGGIEVGFEPAPLLGARPFSRAEADKGAGGGSGEDDDASAGEEEEEEGALIHYALVHGWFRQDWLDSLPKPVLEDVPQRIRSLFGNVGTRPTVTLAAAAAEAAGGNNATLPLLHRRRRQRGAAAALRVENDGWDGGRTWPKGPLETHPSNGFMWNDFFVHYREGQPLYYRPGRGFAFPRDLTRHYLASYSGGALVGIFRAHQHNDARETGPMLSSLREAEPPGIFDNFGRASLVLTFLSGAHLPGFGYPHDSHGILRLPTADPATWGVEGCAQTAGGQFVRSEDGSSWLADGDGGAGVPPAAVLEAAAAAMATAADGAGGAPPAWSMPRNICNPDATRFVCRDVGWKAALPGGAGRRRGDIGVGGRRAREQGGGGGEEEEDGRPAKRKKTGEQGDGEL